MITSSDDKTVKLWTVNRQQFIASLIGHKNWVRSARFSPDARMALSGGDDKVVKLWDCRTRQPIAEYYESRGQINQVKFHPSGNSIAAAGDDCSARIWDLRHFWRAKLNNQFSVIFSKLHLCFNFNKKNAQIIATLHSALGPGDGTLVSPEWQMARHEWDGWRVENSRHNGGSSRLYPARSRRRR